jgi:hypothetical protein
MPAPKMSGWIAFRLARTWVSCLHPVKLNTQGGKKSIAKSEAAFSFACKAEVSR